MTSAGSAATQALVEQVVRQSVHLRGPRRRWGDLEPTHKEWLHFTVHTPELDVVVNFSVSHDGGGAGRVGRVGCLVRHDGWHGGIDTCPRKSLSARSGELDLRMSQNSVRFRDGGFDVNVHLIDQPIEVLLRLEPCALPAQINNFQIGEAPSLNWLVLPRLEASGWVTLGSRQFTVERAPAYHDHNWGGFRWGHDFSWEWGYALSPPDTDSWSLVFARLSDRPRLSDLMRGLFLWRGAEQLRVFSGDEISVRACGLLRETPRLTLPRVMGLLAEGRASDIPARYEVEARRGSDRLEVGLDVRDVARIVIPNDDDLGLTIINECAGAVTVAGEIAGERVSFQSPTIFEFLSD